MRIVILGVRRCVRVACSGWKGVTRVVHSKPPEGKTNHDTEKQTPTNYRKLRLYLYIRIVLYLYIRIVYIYIYVYSTRWLEYMAFTGTQGHTYNLFSNRYIHIVANRQLMWKLLKLGVKRGQLANLAVDT